MKVKPAGILIAIILLSFTLSFAVPSVFAQDTSLSYKLVNQEDGTFSYTLNVVVPGSLNEYYQGLGHSSASDADFPKFITPYAVKPIAESLRQIYSNDEDFVNGVLTLVHQIPYEETLPEYYPVETLLRNRGDCDLFSFIAASIMKADGLDVVLLHYQNEEHMNLGVHLNEPPKNARTAVYSLNNNGVVYYVAEATSSNWEEGWRVGECPDDLKNATATIVTLEKTEELAPGQVSASFKKLEPTKLEVNISPTFAIEGSTLTLQGQINPTLPNQNVTLYESLGGSPWTVLGNAATYANGQFSYSWKPVTTGELQVRASWIGNDQYAGTTSSAKNTMILPFYLVAIVTLAIGAIVVCLIIYAIASRRKPQVRTLGMTVKPESSAIFSIFGDIYSLRN